MCLVLLLPPLLPLLQSLRAAFHQDKARLQKQAAELAILKRDLQPLQQQQDDAKQSRLASAKARVAEIEREKAAAEDQFKELEVRTRCNKLSPRWRCCLRGSGLPGHMSRAGKLMHDVEAIKI